MPSFSFYITEDALNGVNRIVDREKKTNLDFNKSAFINRAILASVQSLEMESDLEFQFDQDQNYILLGRTRHGKSFRIQNLISKMPLNKAIILITPCNPKLDYPQLTGLGFETIEVSYAVDAMMGVLLSGNTLDTVARSGLLDLVKSTWDKIVKVKRVIVYLKFSDMGVESVFVQAMLTRLLQAAYIDPSPRLMILEESTRYDCGVLKQLLSQGLKLNLQSCLVSQFPLSIQVMTNATILLGYIFPTYLRKNPQFSEIANFVTHLKPHEFVYFNQTENKWRKLEALP
jgi:hypothetical protein